MSKKTLPEIPQVLPDKNNVKSNVSSEIPPELKELLIEVKKLKEYAQRLADENKRLTELANINLNKKSEKYENPEFSEEDIQTIISERDGFKKLALAKIKDMIFEKVKQEYPEVEYTSIDEFPEEFHRLVCAKIPPEIAYKVILETKEKGEKVPASMGKINSESEGEKEFYTSLEADKLTKKQLSNPKVMEAVMKSMLKW